MQNTLTLENLFRFKRWRENEAKQEKTRKEKKREKKLTYVNDVVKLFGK